MTEQVPPEGPDPRAEAEAARPEPMRTGVPRVDAVLADLEGLDDVPLEQHPGAFERAHDSLRAALDEPDEDGPERTDDPSGDPA